MSPIVAVVATAFERAAGLIEKGMPPAKAMRQAAQELGEFAERNAMHPIPTRVFTYALGEGKVPA